MEINAITFLLTRKGLSLGKLNEVNRFIKVIYHSIGKFQKRQLLNFLVGQNTEFINRCCSYGNDLHVSRPGQSTEITCLPKSCMEYNVSNHHLDFTSK
jgi:hypothetical protein